jgi:hypothetical protein
LRQTLLAAAGSAPRGWEDLFDLPVHVEAAHRFEVGRAGAWQVDRQTSWARFVRCSAGQCIDDRRVEGGEVAEVCLRDVESVFGFERRTMSRNQNLGWV